MVTGSDERGRIFRKDAKRPPVKKMKGQIKSCQGRENWGMQEIDSKRNVADSFRSVKAQIELSLLLRSFALEIEAV
jgi:hypothetical protein